MRMDKLTSKFQLALADAQSLAVGKDHQYIEPVHVLNAMLNQDGGSAASLLSRVGVQNKTLTASINSILDTIAQVDGNQGEVHLSSSHCKIAELIRQACSKKRRLFYIQ